MQIAVTAYHNKTKQPLMEIKYTACVETKGLSQSVELYHKGLMK